MQHVSENCSGREGNPRHIQPQRRTHPPIQILPQAKLQQERGQSDSGDDDQSNWAEERGAAGINHHQRKSYQQQAGGEDSPAAGLVMCVRIGGSFRQGVPCAKLYRGRTAVSNRRKLSGQIRSSYCVWLRLGAGDNVAKSGQPLRLAGIAVVGGIEDKFDSR
jgi:hypothetical protein